MNSRKKTNFLLEFLMKIIVNIYLYFSALFQVDFVPNEKLDASYTKFNSFDDPLPDIEYNNPDYQEIIAEAREKGEPIKPLDS